MKPYYEDKLVQIFLGDCRDIMPTLETVDLILTDPPYGINYSTQEQGYRNAIQFDKITGDKNLESVGWLMSQVNDDTTFIVFGANNFPHLLPYAGTWLCWDKRGSELADSMLGWPFELAWVSKHRSKAHIYRIIHGGAVNADGGNVRRVHPTQKPVSLFFHILKDYKCDTVLDPFMGSGTTLLAAKKIGCKAIGIEIEERYCEIATKRLLLPYRQELFDNGLKIEDIGNMTLGRERLF